MTTAPRFGTWGPIADAITVTSLTLAITVTPHSPTIVTTHSPIIVTTHSPTIVTTYTFPKNTKSPSLASGTNKIAYSIHSRTPYTFLQPVQGWGYNIEKYREATTKKELCKVDLLSSWGPKKPIEKMRKEYHEYCPKSKSNNIVFCPKEIIKRKSEKVEWINDNFKKTWLKERISVSMFDHSAVYHY